MEQKEGKENKQNKDKCINPLIFIRMTTCSRWTELTETLRFLAHLASSSNSPTEFRFLNGGHPLGVGFGNDNDNNLEQFLLAIERSPTGGTPLCLHLSDLTKTINNIQKQLRENNQKVMVVICTDGEASDGSIDEFLRPLQSMPVQILLKLCTDNEKVVKYWNNIDEVLELNMDVLDDLASEAKEVTYYNPWLTYGEPLHHLRMFGIAIKEFDLLDETPLTMEQMHVVVCAM